MSSTFGKSRRTSSGSSKVLTEDPALRSSTSTEVGGLDLDLGFFVPTRRFGDEFRASMDDAESRTLQAWSR